MRRRHAELTLLVALVVGGCNEVSSPPMKTDTASPTPTMSVASLEIEGASSIITGPGEGKANLRIVGSGIPDALVPDVSVTGPFVTNWVSLRSQLRTLRYIATDTGQGTITVTVLGKSVSFSVVARAVRLHGIVRSGGDPLVAGTNWCGIDADGRAWCAGANDSRQLGTTTPYRCSGGACQYGGTYSNPTPLPVDGDATFSRLFLASYSCSEFIDKGCGAACGITAAGETWCWGGVFGVPVRVAGELTLTSVVVRPNSANACGIATDGKAYCFTKTATTPFGDAMPFSALSLTAYHHCGVSAGDVWCWGTNYEGVLGIGIGDGKPYASPRRATTTGGFTAIETGYYRVCALHTSGTIYCWGQGFDANAGALGLCEPSGVNAQERCQLTPRRLEGGTTYMAIAITADGLGICGRTSYGSVDCWMKGFSAGPTGIALPEPVARIAMSCGTTAAEVRYCWSSAGTVTKQTY